MDGSNCQYRELISVRPLEALRPARVRLLRLSGRYSPLDAGELSSGSTGGTCELLVAGCPRGAGATVPRTGPSEHCPSDPAKIDASFPRPPLSTQGPY